MFLEWWMIACLLMCWLASVIHISANTYIRAFNLGVTAGGETALKVLEDKEIIRIDDETGEVEGLPKKREENNYAN